MQTLYCTTFRPLILIGNPEQAKTPAPDMLRRRSLGHMYELSSELPGVEVKDVSQSMGVDQGQSAGNFEASREIHPLVAEYLNQRGAVGIFRARMRHLNFEHDRSQADREFPESHGEAVRISDELFEAIHRTRLRQVEEHLEIAEKKAVELASRYEEERLDIYPNVPRMFRRPVGASLATGGEWIDSPSLDGWLSPIHDGSAYGEESRPRWSFENKLQ